MTYPFIYQTSPVILNASVRISDFVFPQPFLVIKLSGKNLPHDMPLMSLNVSQSLSQATEQRAWNILSTYFQFLYNI